MALMLPQSCDPGYGQLGIELGVPTLTKQAQDFGYSIYKAATQYVPKLDLPNVVASTFSDLPSNSQANLAYSAIGQYDDATTPLQNALVAAGIANGGVIMTPHLMDQVRDSQGNVVATYKPTPMLTVSTPAAAAAVGKLMQNVADDTVSGRNGERDLPRFVARRRQDGYGSGPSAHRPRADRRLDDRFHARGRDPQAGHRSGGAEAELLGHRGPGGGSDRQTGISGLHQRDRRTRMTLLHAHCDSGRAA